MLRRFAPWLTLIIVALMLPLGVWGPGLWDPWEMNTAFVARKMAEPARVLVAEARVREDVDSLATLLKKALGDSVEIESTQESGKVAGALDAARTVMSNNFYKVVVLDLDAKFDGKDDKDASRKVTDLLNGLVSSNRGSTFLLVSSSGKVDPTQAWNSIRERLEKIETDDSDKVVDQVADAVRVVANRGELADEVESSSGGSGFLAAFKSGGRTLFRPMLDPFMTAISFKIFGLSEFSARLSGAFMGLAVLLLVFFTTRRVFGHGEASLALIILATSPLFFEMTRFTASPMSVVLGLSLGAVGLGLFAMDRAGWLSWIALIGAFAIVYLGGGMTYVVVLTAMVVVYPILVWEAKPAMIQAVGASVGISVLLALLTFVPDGAFFRQFRFTAATFAGGMSDDARAFDFPIKQIGFGFFPWSALLPLVLFGAMGSADRVRPERLVALLWAVVPFVALMITIRPLDHTLYLGLPGLAVLTALYLKDLEDDSMQSRILAFFAFGLFVVIFKAIAKSPAPVVSFLTTDPMFSDPGKGANVFPAGVSIGTIGKLAGLIAGMSLFIAGGRLVSSARRLPEFLARSRNLLIVLGIAVLLTVVDLIVFIALKWDTISGRSGPDAAVGAVLLRIFLTGPDILALYGLILFIIGARYAGAIKRILTGMFGESRTKSVGDFFLSFEHPPAMRAMMIVGAVVFALVMALDVVPEISYHVSQKHIIQTYHESAVKAPGDMFRHGKFSGGGLEDVNFYTGRIDEMASLTSVVARLRDQSKRTFFILPKTQFSEINKAFRDASNGPGIPVLDDRSSRFILVASTLTDGEEDHNWLADATLTHAEFDALPGSVIREVVNFEDKINLVGFGIDSPAIRRGGVAVLKTYFEAKDRVPASYRIFLHIDRVGSSSRIHGDHWIQNLVEESEEQEDCVGCYATTHWRKGDIVVDTYDVKVPIGTPSGAYDIWMGFYNPSGGGRLKVKDFDKDKIRHDGGNRVRIGTMTVE